MDWIAHQPELAALLVGADHADVKVVTSGVSLREFVAGMAAFQTWWLTALYGVRGVFVRLLGMRQLRQPVSVRLRPQDVPMTPGAKLIFFTIRMAKEDEYLVAEVKDQHLDAMLGVAAEPLAGDEKRFHVFTVVQYRNWAGPIYFNVIRPFHHLVVWSMARAGARGVPVIHSGTTGVVTR